MLEIKTSHVGEKRGRINRYINVLLRSCAVLVLAYKNAKLGDVGAAGGQTLEQLFELESPVVPCFVAALIVDVNISDILGDGGTSGKWALEVLMKAKFDGMEMEEVPVCNRFKMVVDEAARSEVFDR